MEKTNRKEAGLRLGGLVIFRNLLKDPVVAAMRNLLEASPETETLAVLYGGFASALFEKNISWSRYLFDLTMQDENVYVKSVCTEQGAPRTLEICLDPPDQRRFAGG